MVTEQLLQYIGAGLFGLAVLHTFSTKYFLHLAHRSSRHAGLWHLLGEVEVVFGFWAFVLVGFIALLSNQAQAIEYLEGQNFTEPLFVFVILVMAGTRPVLWAVQQLVSRIAIVLPVQTQLSSYFLCLTLVPLLGSFITEPAAMTLAALMLRQRFYTKDISNRMKYLTLGVLFVNVSIGGVLTPFAAPPVLMVAEKWGWDMAFMSSTFGWKAACAVFVNGLLATLWFQRDLLRLPTPAADEPGSAVPLTVVAIHFGFLAATVWFAHYPVMFLGLFLLFLGFTNAYQRFQDSLMLREGLLVAFFLAGLVVLGGMQQWWLQPILAGLNQTVLFFGALSLTAVTDNAALTYLGSLVEGLSDGAKYALVAGAVSGGGLTVIANAPNPAGYAILKDCFDEQAISPLGLLLAALVPTAVAAFFFIIF
ncbi:MULTISPECIES: putative Na+/H+ antiporter [unclassified Undibacterium]|uniref:putative Na+/H+ antiporter n=1 Tax=unclassified Undibacterium TaxID=2630295 RepID=UPI002AC8E4D4|nr:MULTISPECIES: putative Na+/H+ antiporter [unclassified Undibacterium]MEB0138252.1 putative Na+/H+ antiporter [Undibacterium sp. CCC2.1]MEB0171587.1 putative Na+/H+ antiporter [Undibacterium sp. CCC1.1]MEB0175493.1 putative Na+/H+ antiporter [Undibacterium sp. CCC3.4]MEB0214787.1 putative Na+/H+ antiporter [Undibacterium sp. 5I2]WPX45274.1 putative Na+/H+ antiporter [Undibacterium sp. CCC3.4]